MNDQMWSCTLYGENYPIAFYRIVDGSPVRVWSKVNSPSAPWQPNMNIPAFETVHDAEEWLDKNHRRCKKED